MANTNECFDVLTSGSKCKHDFQHQDRVCKLSIDASMPYFDFKCTTSSDPTSGSNDKNIQRVSHSSGTLSYDFSQILEVLRYCYDRLAEIECINCVSHTISSIGCIAAFIGFLSRLTEGDNTRLKSDKNLFVQFVKKYMPGKYVGYEDLLYGTLRCGILHSMSFHDTIDSFQHQNKSTYPKMSDCRQRLVTDDAELKRFHAQSNKLVVDHNDVTPNVSAKFRTTATKQYRLSAFELCCDVRLALDKVRKKATPNSPLEKQILEFVRIQVPITAL